MWVYRVLGHLPVVMIVACVVAMGCSKERPVEVSSNPDGTAGLGPWSPPPATCDSLEFPVGLGDGGPPQIEWVAPDPTQILRKLRLAYETRDIALLEDCLAQDFRCHEIRRCGGPRTWGRDTEITIHSRMFDPQYDYRPIRDIQQTIENPAARLLKTRGPGMHPIWVVTFDAHLTLEYMSAEDGVWEFEGPARLHARSKSSPPEEWEIVEWFDNPPGEPR